MFKIILTFLTSTELGRFVLDLLPQHQIVLMVNTFTLSLVTTIIITLDKENDYINLASNNKNILHIYWEMRETALELLSRLKTGAEITEIQERFTELKNIRLQYNLELPYASSKAIRPGLCS